MRSDYPNDPEPVTATPEPPRSVFVPPAAPAARRPIPTSRPSVLRAVNWDDLRVKGWSAALTLATAYVATKPEKWGWLAPVLTAWAAASKPPTMTVPLIKGETPRP